MTTKHRYTLLFETDDDAPAHVIEEALDDFAASAVENLHGGVEARNVRSRHETRRDGRPSAYRPDEGDDEA